MLRHRNLWEEARQQDWVQSLRTTRKRETTTIWHPKTITKCTLNLLWSLGRTLFALVLMSRNTVFRGRLGVRGIQTAILRPRTLLSTKVVSNQAGVRITEHSTQAGSRRGRNKTWIWGNPAWARSWRLFETRRHRSNLFKWWDQSRHQERIGKVSLDSVEVTLTTGKRRFSCMWISSSHSTCSITLWTNRE